MDTKFQAGPLALQTNDALDTLAAGGANSPQAEAQPPGSALPPLATPTAESPPRVTAQIIPLTPRRLRIVDSLASIDPVVASPDVCDHGAGTVRRSSQAGRPRKQREERDPEFSLLCTITYATGTQVRAVRYIDPVTKKKNCFVIGRVDLVSKTDAVVIVQSVAKDLKAGRSPRQQVPTFDQFFNDVYLPWAKKNKKSWKDDVSRYERYFRPTLGHLPLNQISGRYLRALLAELPATHSSPRGDPLSNGTCNRALMLLRAIFRLAVERDYLDENPARRLRPVRENPPSPRAFDQAELMQLAPALESAPGRLRLLILFLLATMLRISEALNARFSDVDHKHGLLHLPVTKAGEAQIVPLSPLALSLIAELEACRKNDFLFPSVRGNRPMSPPRKALRKLLREAGLEESGFHRLRKTAATEAMACEGVDLLTVSRILRHRSIRTTERHYLATSERRLQHAAAQVGNVLQRMRQHRPTRVAMTPCTCSIAIPLTVKFITA